MAEALREFGVYALSQRVGDLRRRGHPIVAEWHLTAHGKRVRRYRLRQEYLLAQPSVSA